MNVKVEFWWVVIAFNGLEKFIIINICYVDILSLVMYIVKSVLLLTYCKRLYDK